MSCPHCSKSKSPFCPQCGVKCDASTKEQKLAGTLHDLMFYDYGLIEDWLRVSAAIQGKYSDDEIVAAISIITFVKGEL